MTALKKYNLKGEELGEIKVDKTLMEAEAHGQMVKDYIVAMRKNCRQWSANTKGRSEVNHSNKKPHKQKGTGNARQGTLAAPQCRGGGVVFGPKPKFDQHVRINQKERRAAINALLAQRIKDNDVLVVDDKEFELKKPSTKSVASFLKKHSVRPSKLLFVGAGEMMAKSIRNLKGSSAILPMNVNGYDLLVAHKVVLSESALKELMKVSA
ncbi:MAG: 50S ribosomal protein L4 [Chlamydiales bacterium]|nr:50S ribosomal protein L4 [Chlamydiales bacterium]MCH9635769.1 50S ribosomal protein L4 [Chlamydiales bacterium]MCH9704319.1 50S ribosomal protein L4 [Chlamydiota bacterium]